MGFFDTVKNRWRNPDKVPGDPAGARSPEEQTLLARLRGDADGAVRADDEPAGVSAPDGAQAADRSPIRLFLLWTGTVQGVGFRWTNQGLARELGLTGWARNLEDGSVAMEVQGAPAAIALEFDRLHESYQRLSIGRVWLKESRQLPVNHTETDFEIRY